MVIILILLDDGPQIPGIFKRRLLEPELNLEIAGRFIEGWLKGCDAKHKCFPPDTSAFVLPKRLLDIGVDGEITKYFFPKQRARPRVMSPLAIVGERTTS